MSVGEFFSEGRKMVDGRKAHLARVGMAPEHVEALRMPEPDLPEAPAVVTEKIAPPATAGGYEQPKPRAGGYVQPRLPPLPGVNVGLEE
ncbi:MAG TPA: hypothetical protein VHH36_09680 [Candidatus Thermoplasmatota archaeon]|nr:hypothetical protein [Candidatus Thermoplasmatota archaeon]